MIDILQKKDCCGCGACHDACPKHAIVWEADEEGFSYPLVDTAKCIDCGLCNKVCPMENSHAVNERNSSFTPTVIAAYHKDEKVRFSSTSGGAFWGLAESWVKRGGYVAGAVFDEHFKVRHMMTNNLEELQAIKGSKYCQSDCRGLYRKAEKLLKAGHQVMATGLPCQMAALRQYLRKDYEHLLVVDLICHSVPSPLLFEKYVEHLEKRHGGKMTQYHPKNKELGGWHHFAFKAYFDNGKVYHTRNDIFTNAAFDSILSRPSCFDCRFKHFPQPSDLTIGDFWGIENIDPSFDSPNGVSKIIVNSRKGEEYIRSLDCFETRTYGVQESVYDNPRAWPQIRSAKACDTHQRSTFLHDLRTRGIAYSVHHYQLPSKTICQKIKKFITLHITDAL